MLNLAVRNTGKLIRAKSKSENVRLGRFFTKKETARLMASMLPLDENKTAYTILDPGAGTGILSAAMVEEICKRCPSCRAIFLTCYEVNPDFIPLLEDNLERIRKKGTSRLRRKALYYGLRGKLYYRVTKPLYRHAYRNRGGQVRYHYL